MADIFDKIGKFIWTASGMKHTLNDWGLWKGPIANLAPKKTKPYKFPKYSSYSRTNYSSYSRSYGTYSVSTQCLGTTRSGRQCRRRVHGLYCNSHSGISSYSPKRSSYRSYTPRRRSFKTTYKTDYSEPSEQINYHEPKMCKAENPSGSCNYSAWYGGDYCSWHSEAKSIGLPTKKDYEKMIEIFNRAVTNKSPVSFNYHRGSSPGKRRKVIPKEVSTSPTGMTFIRAHCLMRDAERNFNLTFLREPKSGK